LNTPKMSHLYFQSLPFMCTDMKGRDWVAGFFGQSGTCWDRNTGEMVSQVKVPAKRITSCCFGGPNFDWLFVVSASPTEEGEKQEFTVQEGESKGFPTLVGYLL